MEDNRRGAEVTHGDSGSVGILGAGAIGSALAALLSGTGVPVVLVGRKAQVDTIRNQGLRVRKLGGESHLAIDAREGFTSPPGLVFVTVKTQDLASALASHRDGLAGSVLVMCQNGLQSDGIAAAAVGADRVVGAVVDIHATALEPGIVDLHYPGPLVLGRPDGPVDDVVCGVAAVLRGAVPVSLSHNLVGARWFKLIVNLNNALPAILNLPMGEVFSHPPLARASVRAMREGIKVAEASGIRLQGLPDVPRMTATLIQWLPLRGAAALAALKVRQVSRRGEVLGSTLQSIRRGRETEIDYLNGEVVRRGGSCSVPVPINTLLTRLVHEVRETATHLTVEELASRLDRAMDD